MSTSIVEKARHLIFAGVLTFALALGFILTGVITSGTSDTGSSWGIEKAYAAKYTLSEKSLTLNVGDYWTISVNETTKAEDKKVKWSSSNTRVAKVKRTKDKNGNYVCKITAVGSGTCTVKALVKGKTCKCKVKVNKVVYKADRENVTVEVGETAKVKITFTGSGTVTFNRSNTSVAEASWSKNWENNTTELYIKGLKPGTMTLLMTNNLTSDSFSISVRVLGTDISTVMNAIDANYTFTNSSGIHGIKRIDYVDGTQCSFAVLSDRASNQLTFIAILEDASDNTRSSVAMDVRSTEDGYVTIEVIDIDLSYNYSFKGTASLQKSAYYKNKSLNWNITESEDYSNSELTELNKKIANNLTSMAMLGWSKVLGDYTGYSLADLGFTSYQP